jgi:uncharacterized membrane protein YoaK (UPF0700 family)
MIQTSYPANAHDKIASDAKEEDRVGRLLATLSAFVVGAVCATAARWLGIEDRGLVVAFAVIGAGIQSITLMAFYLYRTRPKLTPQPFGEPVRFDGTNQESAREP